MPYTETPETNALKQHIETILAAVPDFVGSAADEKQKPRLKINVIKDCAERGDIKLLAPLLKNSSIKKAFFTPVLDSFVFNTAKFKEFLEYSSACNSYSKYLGQKIGLYMGDIPLIDRSEVVLNFPFKDCILEGGQRKEDGLDTYFEYDEKEQRYTEKKSKRREVFYNEVLARDEIDSLFSPKAFCNAKRYEAGKSSLCKKLNRDAELNKKRGLSEDTITDNLIIKGNNLLALHSLKEEFTGKVKLIYIDPPYNTGNDSFAYNDNFNHSSWLTFMKNRLEIARELLKEEGAIFVQCDDNEQAYLKLLMDDVFGRENFKVDFIWNHRKSSQNDIDISLSHNYTLVYAKKIKLFSFIPLPVEEEKFSNPDNDPRGAWVADPFDAPNIRKNLTYPILNPNTGEQHLPPNGRCWRFSQEKFEATLADNRIVFGKTGKGRPQYKRFKSEASKRGINPSTIWDDTGTVTEATKELMILFNGKRVFKTPKPEKLLEKILTISTSESDIVLDYHLGSGTTAAVAHKMNRQYIGVEQMDYIDTVTVERLKKVIEGEQGGISKLENWHGGGSFVYMELAEKNEQAVRLISACENLKELIFLFDELCRKYFLHYSVRIKEFHEEVKTDRFQSLPLKEQKEMFCRMLDLNQLYINADDRHDDNTGLSTNDIAITEDFYRLRGNDKENR
ncbi:site-specific DNA-methyltransferase [Treponema vincentii]|uniref:site-specific DNA-methyltransferase n=1 Tax=Treponema vincentii TaxID=69710 RepID=UPI0020A31D3C|nr:site-specific DNA-methyltransferase [Treponema vincentii]UTC59318.1 site-specific DNA-methyltransferase [Treponema vincentii]